MEESELSIMVTTWATNSEAQEFDRENNELHITQKLIVSQQQAYIFQNTNTFKIGVCSPKQTSSKLDEVVLMKITNRKKNYIKIQPSTTSSLNLYEVISFRMENRLVQITTGDQFKFGRKKMKILSVGIFEPSQIETSNYEINSLMNFQLNSSKRNEGTVMSECLSNTQIQLTPRCRFCLARSMNSENPVISCCGCKGIDNFLHMQCLKQWVQRKCRKEMYWVNNTCYIKRKVLQCEVCHKYFDFNLTVEILLSKPLESFILFQDSEKDLIYMVLCNKQDSISIGRSVNSDFQLLQNTVSRIHAQIFYQSKRNKFFIRDLKSKFGTLKKIAFCKVSGNMQIQVGRNIFYLEKKVKKGFFSKLFKLCSPNETHEIKGQQRNSQKRRNN